jgi:hypothetical protein
MAGHSLRVKTGKNQVPFPNKSTQFQPGKTGNPNGRPKKLLTHIRDDLRSQGFESVTKTQVSDICQSMLNLTIDKLAEITKDESSPVLVRIIGKQLLSQQGYSAVLEILDRAHGKASQKIDAKFNGNIESKVTLNFDKKPRQK